MIPNYDPTSRLLLVSLATLGALLAAWVVGAAAWAWRWWWAP